MKFTSIDKYLTFMPTNIKKITVNGHFDVIFFCKDQSSARQKPSRYSHNAMERRSHDPWYDIMNKDV